MRRFTEKITFITGAASGIGRAAAIAFAREGAWVAITDRTEARWSYFAPRSKRMAAR